MATGSDDARLKEYDVVTQQFRALTDIRFKLLMALPAATVVGSTVFKSQQDFWNLGAAVPLFAFVATLAIFVYNLRNDQHYDELVARAAQIERELGLHDGSFLHRPSSWLRLAPRIYVEHRWPINVIYIGSAALWLWLALESALRSRVESASKVSVVVAVAFAVASMWLLARSRRTSKLRYRRAVMASMKLLVGAPVGSHCDALAAEAGRVLARHLGVRREDAKRFERRILFYLDAKNAKKFLPEVSSALDDKTASHVLAHTIDMPARWIRDVHAGRRGS
jgi:hypothetical protein